MPTLGKTKVSPSLISTGSTFQGTSSYAITASYAMNGGSGGSGGAVQTGSIANQTILYNVTTSQDNVISGLNLSSNKWGVTVVEEWNSGSGDIYYSSSSLLMHFSGSNDSTTFIDNSPNNLTVTSNNGAKITSSISKFGGTSGFFDGTDDYLSINYNSAFNFGTDSFTWESWIYPTNISGIDGIYATSGGSGVNPKFVVHLNAGTPSIHYNNLTNGSDLYTTATSAVSINTWTHLAFVRNGSNWTWYINGNSAGTGTNNTTITFTSQPTYIGYGGESYFTPFNGYIDELRITKGISRYTASFTTQSIEFPNQLPQYETKYIGLVGGLNDTGSDYGVQKLSDNSLKIRKMSVSGTPVSGSPILSSSVDRVYVNVLDYTNVMVTSSYALTASYVLGGIQTGSISNQTILYNVTTSQENTITGLDLSGNKWDVSVIEEWNSGSGDIYFNSCSLLLHFDSLNSSGRFIDNSSNNFTITSSGGAGLSTSQYKFGGASAYFDGVGDYLTIPNNTAFNLSSGSYTIECWIYPYGNYTTYNCIIAKRAASTAWQIYLDLTSGSLRFWNGTTDFNTNVTPTTNTWNHIAVVYNSPIINLYLNGINRLSSSTVNSDINATIAIGNVIGNSEYFYGYMDELRITKGVARYTSNFTPPAAPFPNSATQTVTKYIGLVGGLNDNNVDYGIEKLSDSSLKIKKLTDTQQPSGSFLSSSVDRLYVNVLNYKEVQTTAQFASYAVTSSYLINSPTAESFHPFLLG